MTDLVVLRKKLLKFLLGALDRIELQFKVFKNFGLVIRKRD